MIAMSAESFSQEQIRHFRQVFSQYSDPDAGLGAENFPRAVSESLEQYGFSTPPLDYLNSEFNRLGSTGHITWQQFFQVSPQRESGESLVVRRVGCVRLERRGRGLRVRMRA